MYGRTRWDRPDESLQGHRLQADLRAAVRRDVGAGAPVGRCRAGRANGVLPQRLRHPAGGGDLCLPRRVIERGAHRPAARPARPRTAQRRRHVHQFLRAHAAAAGGRDRDLLRLAADHRGARRRHSERARAHLSLVGGAGRLCRRDRDAGSAFRRRPLCGGGRRDRRHRRLGVGAGIRLLQCRHGDPDPPPHAKRNHVVDRVLFFAGLRASRARSRCRSPGTRRPDRSLSR